MSSLATSGTKPEVETRLFINNEFVESISGKTFPIKNPYTGQVTANVYEADVPDVERAIDAAKAAFPLWSEVPGMGRGKLLYKLADLIEEHFDEFAYLDAISMGAAVGYAAPFLMAAVGHFRYFASLSAIVQGTTSLSMPGFLNLTLRQPYGVTAAIIPWNMPMIMMAIKIGPAMATGNTIVAKSSEKAPLSPLLLAKLVKQAGFPPGVINIISGFGVPAGQALAESMVVRRLAFTGSVRAGRLIKEAAVRSNMKHVTLELGGKSPLVVFPDADLKKAVRCAVISISSIAGQVCMASTRVYVHSSIADDFVKAFAEVLSAIKSGDPLDPTTAMGPLADEGQFEHVKRFLETAKRDGLRIVVGGGAEERRLTVEPTIVRDVPEKHVVQQQEIFGPVVTVNTFDEEEEVLARCNDTEYGLYASVFTKDINRAIRFAKGFEAGTVAVNASSPTAASDMPFGGYKMSGDGRDCSTSVIDDWTEAKAVFIDTT